MSAYDTVQRAIANLDTKNKFTNKQLELKIVKIHPPYWKQLDLDWWRGKAISLIAEDINGNFVVLHSSGIVSCLNFEERTVMEIAKSVKEFMLSLH